MAWHDATPWREKRQRTRKTRTPVEQIEALQRLCMNGDISAKDAIRAAFEIGQNDRPEAAATKKGAD
jgi:hypothetical protein